MKGRVLLVLFPTAAWQFGSMQAFAEEVGVASVYTAQTGGGSRTANMTN